MTPASEREASDHEQQIELTYQPLELIEGLIASRKGIRIAS